MASEASELTKLTGLQGLNLLAKAGDASGGALTTRQLEGSMRSLTTRADLALGQPGVNPVTLPAHPAQHAREAVSASRTGL